MTTPSFLALPVSFRGARISVRSGPQRTLKGGSSDRMPVTMSASSDSRKKRFQLMLSSQRA